jgi:hypothetical protein
MFYRFLFQDHHSERAVYMLQQPVSPEPGRDGDPRQAEVDWLLWCESVENQLDPDEEEPDDAAPWNADLDAIIAECREITAEEAALAARAVRRGLPGGTPIADGRRGLARCMSSIRPAPGPGAEDLPPALTSSTTFRTRRADEPACVMAALNAGATTG